MNSSYAHPLAAQVLGAAGRQTQGERYCFTESIEIKERKV